MPFQIQKYTRTQATNKHVATLRFRWPGSSIPFVISRTSCLRENKMFISGGDFSFVMCDRHGEWCSLFIVESSYLYPCFLVLCRLISPMLLKRRSCWFLLVFPACIWQRLHVFVLMAPLLHVFSHLALVACFPALDIGCMFFPRSASVGCFLALGFDCMFSRATWALVVYFPRLATAWHLLHDQRFRGDYYYKLKSSF